MTTMRWRPIAECPPELKRAVVFDPKYAWPSGDGLCDERVVMAERVRDGRWWFSGHEGGAYVEPTHFLDPGVPDGFPVMLDADELRARFDAERIERERMAQIEADARAARAAARQGEAEAEREVFWADPDKRREALTKAGDP